MPNIKSLQQVEWPRLKEHQVHYSNLHHLVIIDGVIVPCTPTEYDILLLLLFDAGKAVASARLLGLSEQQLLARNNRRCLTQHMSNLRAKLFSLGLDISCVTGYGYLLLSRPKEQEEDM